MESEERFRRLGELFGCPECGELLRKTPERLFCSACLWKGKEAPYYLRKRLRQGGLWCVNLQHLQYLRRVVEAQVRSHDHAGCAGCPICHQSIQTKLPKWVLAASNRGSVLAALQEMQEKVKKR